MNTRILPLTVDDLDIHLPALAEILSRSVGQGAAIGFMAPLTPAAAQAFWAGDVRAGVAAGGRVVFAAFVDDALVGTVQLLTAMPANQPHRAEIAKMIVHPQARRQGLGRKLMEAALAEARAEGRTLVTLDTRTGDLAEPLYASLGFEVAGIIPDYAWDADGRARHATTLMYRRL